MAALTIVRVLFCGQGMTNLVEVYADGDETKPPDWLALVDCGGSPRWARTAIDTIVSTVAARATKRIDCIVISHQDGDHLRLLTTLGPRLKAIGASVGTVFLGGLSWGSGNRATVYAFLDLLEYDRESIGVDGPEASDYRNATVRAQLTAVAGGYGTYIRRLVTNVTISAAKDIQKNGSSAVVVVDDGTSAVILPGDATLETMDAIAALPEKARELLPRPVLGISVPHHGALRTAVSNYVASGDPTTFGYASVDRFVQYLKSQRAAASAGPRNGPKHPMEEVLVRFHNPLLPAEEHTYVSWVFNRSNGVTADGWDTRTSSRELRCTVRSLGDDEPAAKRRKTSTGVAHKLTKVEVGDIVFRLAPPGVVPAEQVMEFVPRGTVDLVVHSPDDGVVYAPAP